jgi:prepilin-type N-terminal cleavage/methylation domain-containing protein
MMKARPFQAGFSLIEVMCAMVVLGVGLVGLTRGISLAVISSKESELQTAAALLAGGLVETLRAEGNYVDGSTEGDFGEALRQYRWQQTISKSGIDGLHRVEVVVRKAGSEKIIYELQTLLFEVPDDTTAGANKRREPGRRPRNGPAR